jgi:hypothetical protein
MMSSEKIFAILLAFSGLQVCRGAAIGDIARNVRSELVRLDAGLNPQSRRSKGLSLDVPAGGAVDMFYRYGFFSLSVRVVPRDDPGKWLIREPTADIFDRQSIIISETAGTDTFARQPFQISLCDDLDELLSAFFRDFKADGVEQPHKLFTGSWRLPTAAQYLGLSPQALDDSVNSYVLVKLVRNKGTKAASGNIRLDSEAAAEANKVQAQNSDAILKFVKNYGTHYFRTVTVGEAIYQVFALSKEQMQSLSASYGGQRRRDLSLADWPALHEKYLAPWLVKETGEIKAASGNVNVQRFIEQELRIEGQFGSYPNLIEGLIKNPGNVQTLEDLTTRNSAVIGLEFSTLRDFFPSIEVREFYDETFAAQSALWGANM